MFFVFLFSPAIALILPLGLMFWKKLSNGVILFIMSLCHILVPIIMGREIVYQREIPTTSDIISGVLMGLILFFINCIPYYFAYRAVELHRCPKCRNLGAINVQETKDERIINTTETYEYMSQPGVFRKKCSTIFKHVSYKQYCPHCHHVYFYNEDTTEYLRGREKRIK